MVPNYRWKIESNSSSQHTRPTMVSTISSPTTPLSPNTKCTSHVSCAECESQKRWNCFLAPHFCTSFTCCLECISIPPILTMLPPPNSKSLANSSHFPPLGTSFPFSCRSLCRSPERTDNLPSNTPLKRVLGVLSIKLHALRLSYFAPGEVPEEKGI